MDYNYLAKIKAQVNLYTRRKSSNILEGDFRSVFRGRSLEFDDLKEYDFGDNVHDIDWKSSSRTGKTLIRRYVAEKKHNILFVGDCGSKMEGDTPSGEQKSEVALMIFGTLAYLGDRQGADYSLAYAGDHGYRINYFRSGTDHLEKQLYSWRKEMAGNGTGVFEVLSRSVDTQRKKMMIFLITDLPGLAGLNENLVRRVTMNNDLLVIVIEDVSMFAPGAYDLAGRRYVIPFLSRFGRLKEMEARRRKEIMDQTDRIFRKYRVNMTTISSQDRIMDGIVELLERNRYGFHS